VAWLSIRLCSDATRVETICDMLTDAGAVAVTLSDAADAPVVEPAPGDTPLWPVVDVDALFSLGTDLSALRDRLRSAMDPTARDAPLDVRFVEDADWSQTWRNHTNAYHFGGRLWVVPRDAAAPADGVVLRLDPGLAFGTGGHATTALCLEWLAGRSVRGWSVVDFGAGSGILGIAALLLGADHVTAVDHDPQARVATAANATYNGIAPARLDVVAPDAVKRTTHDLVLANILAGPLMSLAPQLTELVKPGGRLVVSGLLLHQVDAVTAHYPQFEFAPAHVRDAWAMVEGTRTRG
jgi:ribosomal protein L11 methyltransferase